MRFAAFACLLSGLSALIYQSLWHRLFSLAFGGTRASLSLVLSLFMAGLALGSYLALRRPARNPLFAYAICEAGMGFSALIAQIALSFLPQLWSLLPGSLATLPIKMILAALITVPCAAFAGAGLPYLFEALESEKAWDSRRFGLLYALNALGAALGAWLCAFILIPAMGIHGAVAAAAAVNFSIAEMARRFSKSGTNALLRPGPGKFQLSQFTLIAFLTGLAAFLLEILWTRSLVLTLGSSAYAFASMVSAVLVGIALGSLLYARLESKLTDAQGAMARTLSLLALFSLASGVILGWMPELLFFVMRRVRPGFSSMQGLGFFLSLVSLLPVTVLQGLAFPMLLRASQGGLGARHDSAQLYMVNTLGGVCGAMLGGLLLIPWAGIQALFPLAAAAYLAALPLRVQRQRALVAALALMLALLGLKFYRPWNTLMVTSGVFQSGFSHASKMPKELSFRDSMQKQSHLSFYEEGREATVAVREYPSETERSLVINGKVDASLKGDAITQKLLAHLPLLLNPAAKSAMVIGWGSGATAGSALTHPLQSLLCVEIEPSVLRTAPFFSSIQNGALQDPRFSVRLDDARQVLLREKAAYDVVISEPSNPWISGVSNLYTGEFYRLAKKRLNPQGVFCQWFHYYSMTEADLKLQIRTFASAFPKVSAWMIPQKPNELAISGDLLLLGSTQDLALDPQSLAVRLGQGSAGLDLAKADCCEAGEAPDSPKPRGAWWLLALMLLDDADLRAWAGDGPLNSDAFPRLEFSAPRSMARTMREQGESNLKILRSLESGAADPLPKIPGPRGESLFQLGRLDSMRGLYSRAMRRLYEAENLGQKGPVLDLALGRALFYSGKKNDAARRFSRAFPVLQAEYVAFLKEGGFYLKQNRPDIALGVFEMGCRAMPKDGDAQYGRGLSLARLGRRQEALAAVNEALRLKPNLEIAIKTKNELEAALKNQGQ